MLGTPVALAKRATVAIAICTLAGRLPVAQAAQHTGVIALVASRDNIHSHGPHGHDHGNVTPSDETGIASTAPVVGIGAKSSNGSAVSTPVAVGVPMQEAPPDHHHSHGSHAAPKIQLDDADIHRWHAFPPSYLAADFRLAQDSVIFGEDLPEDWDADAAAGNKKLMVLHVLFMCIAYFAALPIALALRAAGHASHHLANVAFLIIAGFGWLTGVAYKAASVDRYEGQIHGSLGNVLVLLSLALAGLDSVGLIGRAASWARDPERTWSSFSGRVLQGASRRAAQDTSGNDHELLRLVEGGDTRHDDVLPWNRNGTSRVVFSIGDEEEDDLSGQGVQDESNLAGSQSRARVGQFSPISRDSVGSNGSDGTLRDLPSPSASSPGGYPGKLHPGRTGHFDDTISPLDTGHESARQRRMRPKRLLEICLIWIRRTQVVFAYVVLITGVTVYTGMCRGSFVHGCAAHYIKGSIFFGYGVLTFARYLGAYADIGWAWNKRPAGVNAVSAEMVECAVIFTYGITNTWMERFGSQPGEPYTVKQVQHISIAVMFWFAGLSGMLLESRRVRRILASAVTGGRAQAVEPPSYAFSFNPLPALVIAVTGLAMAAHHQDYVFQVEIHSLWGILLAGGSVFRFLTYFYLWLRPPVESEMPSRPPTEVLTSFGWAAGGIVFMLSNEEISYAAMRAGYDDMMAFLNVTVALTCLVFCWEVVVMAIKGMAVLRQVNGKQSLGRLSGFASP